MRVQCTARSASREYHVAVPANYEAALAVGSSVDEQNGHFGHAVTRSSTAPTSQPTPENACACNTRHLFIHYLFKDRAHSCLSFFVREQSDILLLE